MLSKVMDALLVVSMPTTAFLDSRPAHSEGVPCKLRTYVVCLDRGKDVPYDWDAMRVIREEKKTAC